MDYVIMAYDVVKNRRRAKVMKALKASLSHVQKSVFEGPIREGQGMKLLESVARLVDLRQDSVRMYHLCPQCRRRVDILGVAMPVPLIHEDVIVT